MLVRYKLIDVNSLEINNPYCYFDSDVTPKDQDVIMMPTMGLTLKVQGMLYLQYEEDGEVKKETHILVRVIV